MYEKRIFVKCQSRKRKALYVQNFITLCRFYQSVKRSNFSLPKSRIDSSGGSFYTAFPKNDEESALGVRNRLSSEGAPIGFEYDEARLADIPRYFWLSYVR